MEKKIKTDDVSRIEGKIYKLLDEASMTADDRTKAENLVADLADLVFKERKGQLKQ